MKTNITLEEALAKYNDSSKDLKDAEEKLITILCDLSRAQSERDKAWFEYVKFASEKNYDLFEYYQDYLNLLDQKRTTAHVNYKLRKLQFKKAKKLYTKLQRQSNKTKRKTEKQLGEE